MNKKKFPKSPITIPSKHITNVHYSGLRGRIVHYPSTNKKNKKTFVMVSGHHSSHERMLSFIEFLADYGDVYSIDIPGFGGMDPLPKIGKDVNYDNYAEYLYTVMKTSKLTKDVTVFTVSIGGQFVTRMLQKYPESQDWVSKVVGFVTFGAGKDFHLSLGYKAAILPPVYVGATRIGVTIVDALVFNPISLRLMLNLFSRFKKKMRLGDDDLRKRSIQMEYFLWRINDHYTQARTTKMMFYGDLRRYTDKLIKVPMHNIVTKSDQYVDDKELNKTFRDLYESYTPHYLTLGVHMPSITSGKESVAGMFNDDLIHAIMGPKES